MPSKILKTNYRASTLGVSYPRRFDVGPRCFVPTTTPSEVLVSLPESPLTIGLLQVLTTLGTPYVSVACPSTDELSTATLWFCDDTAYSAASEVPFSLRTIVFSAASCVALPSTAVLPQSTPTVEILDLCAAWSTTGTAMLSDREREILSLVSRGLSNEDIAASCYVSTATVKTHLLRSFRKLGVPDRAAAVYKAVKLGLIV